jgi:hypothetical protein
LVPVSGAPALATSPPVAIDIGASIPGQRLRGDSVLKMRQAKGYRCAGSLQGVKILKGGTVPTAKWGQGNIYCVETGIAEKDHWMLGHDK